MRIHRHKIYLRIHRPFSGSVESEKPNPRPHDWVTQEQVCRCGAKRFVNLNQQEAEISHWQSER